MVAKQTKWQWEVKDFCHLGRSLDEELSFTRHYFYNLEQRMDVLIDYIALLYVKIYVFTNAYLCVCSSNRNLCDNIVLSHLYEQCN